MMFQHSIDGPLPSDKELVDRDNVFLKLINKYSIDEDEDAQLADLGSSAGDNVEEDNASGSSFGEASSVEGDSVKSSAMETMTKELQPLIQKRVDDWPTKGIHLQLKRVDPSVTVEEWLNANQEFTTTTKKYKKTVVTEENKTVVTTTKQTKTTTKKSSFNSFAPRFFGIQEAPSVVSHREKDPAVADVSNDSIASHTSSKDKKGTAKKQMKPKDHGKISKNVKEHKTKLSTLVDPPATIKQAQENVEVFAKPDQPTKKKSEPPAKKPPPKTDKKTSQPVVMPPLGYKSRLRSMSTMSSSKENIVEQVQNEPLVTKQSTVKPKATKKTNKRDNQIELPSTSVVPFEKKSETVHRSRSPLKERVVNRNGRVAKLRNVSVNIEKMPDVGAVATRTSARMQKNALQQASDGTSNALTRRVSTYDRVVDTYDYEAQTSTSSMNRSHRNPRILITSETLQRQIARQIVIHSPSSESLLGTKIDDTLMLVKRNDYEKIIDSKYRRKPIVSALDNSVVAINRRFVYQPPIIDTINENTDYDSECDDDLLTTYTNTGHIVQMSV